MTAKGVAYLIVFWIAFTVVQAAGFLSLSFTGIHSKIVRLFLGVFLLLPGSVFMLLLALPFSTLARVMVTVNLVAWWGFKKWGQTKWWRAK